ncbi:MAG: hypothetical protein QNK84_08950 [Flavobacteriales bacterium]
MKFTYFIFLFSVILFSCGNDTSDSVRTEVLKSEPLDLGVEVSKGEVQIVEPVIDESIVVLENNGITLTEVKTEGNGKATIVLNTKQFTEGENHLSFSVDGAYDYSIAYLANNYALSQFSSDIFNVELLYGNNVFLAFLTNKNGVSIKTNKGSVLRNAVLGGVESLFDMKQPHLFYNLPLAKTSDPVLDFYLVNAAISEKGNKVKVTINKTEFIINKWAAYKISGLKDLENTVRIQLLDRDNNIIEGPFNNSGERRFVVKTNA